MLNKTIVIAIILLFIGIALSPVITAVDNEPIDNSDENEASDDYREIFTCIDGAYTDLKVKRRGIFIHLGVEIEASHIWGITIRGIRFPFIGGIRFPFIFFEKDVYYYVKVPCLIGYIEYRPMGHVFGFAFGNIEWRE